MLLALCCTSTTVKTLITRKAKATQSSEQATSQQPQYEQSSYEDTYGEKKGRYPLNFLQLLLLSSISSYYG